MPVKWSPRKVAESLDELERILSEAKPILKQCSAKALETAKIPDLPTYMSEPLMFFGGRLDDTLAGMFGRIKSIRGNLPEKDLAREQASFERLVAYFNGDREKAEIAMNLSKPKRTEPSEQMRLIGDKMGMGENPDEEELEDDGELDE